MLTNPVQTDALELAGRSTEAGLKERLSWGVIEFQVVDLDRTISFWTSALGLTVREQNEEWVALGTETKTLFEFRSGATVCAGAEYSGLYHVAIGVPDQQEFSRMLARLRALNIPNSPVDHLMSKAIYFNDPDGLEIEIAYETPERFGSFGDMSKALVLYDAEGNTHNGREPLDINTELLFAQTADLEALISNEATIAHLHFKVANLDSAATWFEGIGFARNLMLPHFGFADMGAGADYTHRLAMNSWAGPNATPAPENMARLTQYSLHIHDPAVLLNAHGVEPFESGLTGIDPTGTQISILPAF